MSHIFKCSPSSRYGSEPKSRTLQLGFAPIVDTAVKSVQGPQVSPRQIGDADPSNVSALVHGAEMRVAETRAVNRALRKAYGIGICSVEEIGSFAGQPASRPESKKQPQPTNGNGNYGGPTVRDRLCQLIRQHKLDATLVKSYATDFCGVKTLREATREQVENFVVHLADWAEKNRDALLCQLTSYLGAKEGAA